MLDFNNSNLFFKEPILTVPVYINIYTKNISRKPWEAICGIEKEKLTPTKKKL